MYGPRFEMDAPALAHKGLLASCHVCAAVVLQINGDSQQHRQTGSHSHLQSEIVQSGRGRGGIEGRAIFFFLKREGSARVKTNPPGAVICLLFNIVQSKVLDVSVSASFCTCAILLIHQPDNPEARKQ